MAIFRFYDAITSRLRASGDYVWPLALRLILAWEFWEAGITKLNGENWFAQIPWADWQKGFPYPFGEIPIGLNWQLATWSEMVFAMLLLFGLFTRFAALSLVVVTAVATAAVHWPGEWNSLAQLWQGYVITADDTGNYKLPLLFVVMLFPLIFQGGGKISLDHMLVTISGRNSQLDERTDGLQSIGLALFVLGLASFWVEPIWGLSLFGAAFIAVVVPEMTGRS